MHTINPHTDTLLRDIYQGITTVSADGVSYALVIAFFLANLPEVRPIAIVGPDEHYVY
jgi:hypothetical protein